MLPSLPSALTDRLAQEPNLVAVWLMGSAVTDRLRPDSDLDLAALYENGHAPSFEDQARLAGDLEKIAGRRVDLGFLGTRNVVYAHEALTKGELLLSKDPVKEAEFVATALSMYFDLKIDRKEIEDAYQTG